ncbi:hypothetical protein ACLOJK_014741 [Asimina triloba]
MTRFLLRKSQPDLEIKLFLDKKKKLGANNLYLSLSASSSLGAPRALGGQIDREKVPVTPRLRVGHLSKSPMPHSTNAPLPLPGQKLPKH